MHPYILVSGFQAPYLSKQGSVCCFRTLDFEVLLGRCRRALYLSLNKQAFTQEEG